MYSKSDRAAQSSTVGLVIIVFLIVTTIGVYESGIAPQMSQEAEINAHNHVESGLLDLDSAVHRSGATNVTQSAAIGSSVKYPPQLKNVIQPRGVIESEEITDGSLVDVNSCGASYCAEVREDISGTFEKSIETPLALNYTRSYNYYSQPNVYYYENSVLFKHPPGQPENAVPIGPQKLVKGRTVTIATVNESFSVDGSGRVSLAASPHKTITRTNMVADNDLIIKLPTKFDDDSDGEELWKNILETQRNERFIEDVDVTGNTLTIRITGDGSSKYYINMYTVRVDG